MTADPTEKFLQGLKLLGCDSAVRGDLIVFEVTPATGAYAGQAIETGVATAELAAWSSVPPHWVHFPDQIQVGPTNARPSPLPGWTMHSRNLPGWGDAEVPEQAWIAHVRSVLG